MHWLILICLAVLTTSATYTADAGMVTYRFKETDDLLANPGKGWMTSDRMPRADRPPRLPCSVAYFRLQWLELEPQEGQYNWKPIDDAIEAWGRKDVRIAMRIMTTSAHSSGYYCSPKWLFDAGCKFHEYERGGGDPTSGGAAIKRIEPDYSDPIYLSKHAAFVKALGNRYDGSASVEFIDIGSYGIWGEWHTPNGKPWETRKAIIDMYLAAFRKTPLMQMSDDPEALGYAISHGAGYRRDGVGSPWHEQNWIGSKKYADVAGFADQWTRSPVVFEWFGSYDYLAGRKWSFDAAVNFMLNNHVTYIFDNIGKVPPEQFSTLEKLSRLAGYRFVLREASLPATARAGAEIPIAMKWSNVGVAKLYRHYDLKFYLRDASGAVHIVEKQPAIDVTQWLPGDHEVRAQMTLPKTLPAGAYMIDFALTDPANGKPAIALAIDAPHQDRVYRIGKFRVEP